MVSYRKCLHIGHNCFSFIIVHVNNFHRCTLLYHRLRPHFNVTNLHGLISYVSLSYLNSQWWNRVGGGCNSTLNFSLNLISHFITLGREVLDDRVETLLTRFADQFAITVTRSVTNDVRIRGFYLVVYSDYKRPLFVIVRMCNFA